MKKLPIAVGPFVGVLLLGVAVDACSPNRPGPTPAASPTSSLSLEEYMFYSRNRTMPKFVGQAEPQIAAILNPVARFVAVKRVMNKTLAVGKTRVFKQLPKPGKPLKEGQQIRLWIYYGTKTKSSDSISVKNDRARKPSVRKKPNDRYRKRDYGRSWRRGGGFCSRSRWC